MSRTLEPPRADHRRLWRATTLFLAMALISPVAIAQVADDANVLFLGNVSEYLELRERLRQGVAPEHIVDPNIRAISGALLAATIRQARQDAEPGDILPPALADAIVDRLRRAFDPTEVDGLLTELYPVGVPTEPRLNHHYPDQVAVSVPVSVLSALPPLPAVLGYRLVGRAIVIWDEEAEIVIDAIFAALPEPQVWEFVEVSSTEMRRRVRDALATAHLDPRQLLEDMARDTEPDARLPMLDEKFDWRVGAAMPASVLHALPALPKPLEYRFVGPALIVIDVESGYVKGILRDALPAFTRSSLALNL